MVTAADSRHAVGAGRAVSAFWPHPALVMMAPPGNPFRVRVAALRVDHGVGLATVKNP
jgi:hypothetical protein